MTEDIKHLEMVWQGRQIAVSYENNWLNSDYWHIELRSEDVLPVTKTGFLSRFVRGEAPENEDAVVSWVLEALDQAAEGLAWKEYIENSRQLSLF